MPKNIDEKGAAAEELEQPAPVEQLEAVAV
jgi:hypothetical protein